MTIDPGASSRLVGAVGLLSVPSVVCWLGLIAARYLPESVFFGRVWLMNAVRLADVGGLVLSLICAPIAVWMTISQFRRLTHGDRIVASILATVSLSSLVPLAFILFRLASI